MKRMKFNVPQTPQEIDDHKRKWYPGYVVGYHTDHKIAARDWVKDHVPQCSYKHKDYTDVYEHTYCFENYKDAYDFDALFGLDS